MGCDHNNPDHPQLRFPQPPHRRDRQCERRTEVQRLHRDELGRPCRTTYGSGSNAITESTTYTIQGWTASKWSDLLRQSWHYENSSLPSWTGNITRWDWSHLAAAGESDSSGDAASYQQRSELFGYDALNRLSGSAMTVGTGASATSDSRWSERNIRYDLDGNILHLER